MRWFVWPTDELRRKPKAVCPQANLLLPSHHAMASSGRGAFCLQAVGILERQLPILTFPLIDRVVREVTSGGSRECRKLFFFFLLFLFLFHNPKFLIERPLTGP